MLKLKSTPLDVQCLAASLAKLSKSRPAFIVVSHHAPVRSSGSYPVTLKGLRSCCKGLYQKLDLGLSLVSLGEEMRGRCISTK